MKRLTCAFLILCFVVGFSISFITVQAEEIEAEDSVMDIEYGDITFWRLVLKEDIGVYFELSYKDSILEDANAYVEVRIAGDVVKTAPVSTTHNLQVSVAPAQMTDEIVISIVSGDGSRDELGTYSVKAYANQILAGPYDSATKNLVKAMLVYGAMTQIHFQYRTDELANTGIVFTPADMPALGASTVCVRGEAEGIILYGVSVCYESKLSLRYYFEAESGLNYTFTVNGTSLMPKEKDGLYYVEITDILPQEIGNYLCVCVEDGQGKCLNVTYNPMDYLIRMYHNSETATEERSLLQALYTYHLYAKKYIA